MSPLRPDELATCGDDGCVKLWDTRRVIGSSPSASGAGQGARSDARPLMLLPSHREPVLQLAWSPHRKGVLASSDSRGLVFVWDVDASEAAAGFGDAPKQQRGGPPRRGGGGGGGPRGGGWGV